MRRKRKVKYTWLPNDTRNVGGDGNFTTKSVAVDFSNGGDTTVTGVIPLLNDVPQDEEGGGAAGYKQSMADIIGSEYYIKRIVGKLYASLSYGGTEDPPALGNLVPVLVKTGIFIARNGDGGDVDLPLGWTTNPTAFSTLDIFQNREPWIFQRSWVLGFKDLVPPDPALPVNSLSSGALRFPMTNLQYGAGLLDGPHIDIKTSRRVKTEERLFWVTTVSGYPPPRAIVEADLVESVLLTFDYRVLGALRRARNRGAF